MTLSLAGIALLAGLAALLVPREGELLAKPQTPSAEDKRPHVETALPVRKTLYRKLALPGDVLPYEQAAIFARVQGYLKSAPVDRGTFVEAGDLLATISVPELEKQLEKERAELAMCAPKVARDRAALAWKEAIYTRLEELGEKTPNLINRETLDDASGQFEVAKAELGLTQSGEAVLRAAVDRTQAMIEFATIRAPFDGVVTERWVDPGDLVQPASTKMFHVMRTDPVRVRIHIPQSDVQSVRDDSRAVIRFDELPDRKIEAAVARRFWALDRGTKTMSTEIDVTNPDTAIRPGMFARVEVELEARPGALTLPASALISERKKTFVFVIRDGTAKKAPITVGIDDGIEFEVRDGIQDDDEVIVTGKNLVSDGERARTTRRP